MNRNLAALACAALLMTGAVSPALAQDGYYRDGARERHEQFGQRDVISLLERRGYRVRDVRLERGRYFVRASRRDERLLVIVSRRGQILETRRMTTDRF